MKQLFLLGISLLLVWGCTPPAPQPAAAVQAPPTTTSAFDGTYANSVVYGYDAPCPNLNLPPALTISNGLALWRGPNLKLRGHVTPQGVLAMSSASGRTGLQGQIDTQYVLRAHVTGPNCAYDITWNRVSPEPQLPEPQPPKPAVRG
jgi:hypothetical protein